MAIFDGVIIPWLAGELVVLSSISGSQLVLNQFMDTLNVKGIRAYGYTGYFDAEQFLGQWFEVDLTIWIDLAKAGQSDDLNDTLNYADAVAIVQKLIRESKFKMIEKLAEAIADAILGTGKTQQVKVALTKCQAPIPDFDGDVTLEILRSR
ncbi:slr1626 [Synechocystis sp. PCC 6803]|jgi:dihydroneopterin aldolase|nr:MULTISPECIES: dihydroneopterin aldolase [unclassified Synechocystis]WLT38026.1 dihydroneopterin aldolase [Synechocystis sp. B12]BAM54845.1 hypothetical protein BEST7613_5914 [Synechocystis sp. PCC 6803] [Bacillus subtilis BEST7613]AGF52124.1 hypothetical protein MYO_118790 [Synechocystis sp. PCC 6803]ALJ68079.1 dihydroneopterin aldolase [Synechocystis sp. PCC 6803]AVP89912.1 dihydroneopterin aldolase [Synechocystis sp. IPPAS B-1465]